MIEVIEIAIQQKQIVRFAREDIDSDYIYGIPLLLQNELVLVQFICDFTIDGFKVLCLRDITEVYRSEEEIVYKKIMEQEGIFKEAVVPQIENFINWKGLFEYLKKKYRSVIIECEELGEEDFYIGKVVEATETEVKILYYNTMYRWNKVPDKIQYDSITLVSFGDRYSTISSKYCRPSGA